MSACHNIIPYILEKCIPPYSDLSSFYLIYHLLFHSMAEDKTNNNVKIIGRQTIKPCFPTPKDLKTLKLSKLDQLAVDMYIPLVLFYPSNPNLANRENPNEAASRRTEHLRKTLAKALVQFYPLAGRLRDNMCVECNDYGVEFFEAVAAFSMEELLGKSPDLDAVTQLVAAVPEIKEASLGGCALLVQVHIDSLYIWTKIFI